MKKTIIILALMAAGCGSAQARTEATQPTDTATTTVEVHMDDTNARVQKVLDEFMDKYGYVMDQFGEREPIEKEIADACAARPDGFPQNGEDMAMAAMVISPLLSAHGHTWDEFMQDAAKANVKIQKIVGCQ